MLKKEYKFEPSNAAGDEEPDEDGITPSMLEFSWERDVTPQVSFIYVVILVHISYSYRRLPKYIGGMTRRT